LLNTHILERALDARDARFDGVFFVGIITTGIYCRPVCPARVSYSSHRRFFNTAAAAERAGFRPCLRCRPELAPGRAVIDAVARLADMAAHRIGAGALNGRSVADLARELRVSERHLRRVLERELGVSPLELAQTHRLLLAKRLLVDTRLPVTQVAFASGFQSLRRFNSVFRERYRLSPSMLRRAPRPGEARRGRASSTTAADLVRLTLTYRAPIAWDAMIDLLGREATPGVATVEGRRYGRTISIAGRSGVFFAEDSAPPPASDAPRLPQAKRMHRHVTIDVSPSLVPVLMPLLSRLRQLFDLDAEPTVVDSHLKQGGLGALVSARPGLRIPGAIDGFEVALAALIAPRPWPAPAGGAIERVAAALGEPIETGAPGLVRLAPTAARIADAGAAWLAALGVPVRRAEAAAALARMVADDALRLELGADLAATRRTLVECIGMSEAAATIVLMRACYWPDAFPSSDRVLQRAAGVSSARALAAKAELWRPWRAYAALHLRLSAEGARDD
jgi:AraC family transcriptional regulator, regulatory protein of adaptative response / DNA-3-methyladenine glycosylase II